MGDENKIRDAADAIKGVVEAVPVYQDVIQPAAKEVGVALQKVTKTIHIVLAPLYALVWGYDKISEYLDKALADKLKYVPPEQIVEPPPTVAGPTLEALRFAASEPSLRELYANLLATSMDANTAQDAHPAFVEIIKQLSPDEARIIRYLSEGTRLRKVMAALSGNAVMRLRSNYDYVFLLRYHSTLAEDAGCAHAELYESYFDNLIRQRLIEVVKADEKDIRYGMEIGLLERKLYRSLYDKVAEDNRVERLSEPPSYVKDDVVQQVIQLTPFGLQFCRACVDEGKHGEPPVEA
jgi:hypothetical protein